MAANIQEPKDQEMENDELSEISLRPMEVSDLDDFMLWAADDKVSRYCVWEIYTSKEQGLHYIKSNAIPHPWHRVICIKNRSIGAISVTPSSGNDLCRGELGYVLAYKYWGKGIVCRAVEMVVCSIFDEWKHLERLQALVDVGNKASQRVLEKAGFLKEGVLRKYIVKKGECRDMAMFSLLRSDKKLE